MRQLRFLILWLTVGWLFVGGIIFFSLIPSPPETLSFHGGDKLIHLTIYAVMMLWFGFIYLPGRKYMIHGLTFISLGILLEVIQGILGYRSFEYLDMLSNAIGVLIGWVLSRTPLSSFLYNVERVFTDH